MSKKIILTGGGTAGHVTPNIALLPRLREEGYEIVYIGSYTGIEKELIEAEGVKYYGISSGKFRRYRSAKNLSDPFRVIKGYFEAKKIIKKEKPDVLFSKGGFVSVPVVFAAKHRGVPAIIHESDMTPGLANRLCIPRAKKICCNFPETVEKLPAGKAVLSGSPIRKELFQGDRQKGLDFAGFDGSKPVLLVMGGSTGALNVNKAIWEVLPQLLDSFDIIHLCGKGKTNEELLNTPGYKQYEYIGKELPDIFAAADLVVSRAGANAICELLALKKPNILIPLGLKASRGDQILNAESFAKQGFSVVMHEETMTPQQFLQCVGITFQDRQRYVMAMEHSTQNDAIETIIDLIKQY